MTWRSGLATAVLGAVSLASHGTAQMPNGQVLFKNTSDHAVWVTLYQYGGRDTKLSFGCVSGGGTTLQLNTPSARVANWKGFYVLGEVKQDKTSCANHSNIQNIEPGVLQRSSHMRFATANYSSGPTVVLEPNARF